MMNVKVALVREWSFTIWVVSMELTSLVATLVLVWKLLVKVVAL